MPSRTETTRRPSPNSKCWQRCKLCSRVLLIKRSTVCTPSIPLNYPCNSPLYNPLFSPYLSSLDYGSKGSPVPRTDFVLAPDLFKLRKLCDVHTKISSKLSLTLNPRTLNARNPRDEKPESRPQVLSPA